MKTNGLDGVHGVHIDFDAAPTAAIAAGEHIRRFDQIPDIISLKIPPVEWLVEGLIARRNVILWAGPGGIGKSFLAQTLAVAVAIGGKFLEHQCQKSPVLYIDYENPGYMVQRRFEGMTEGPIENLKVWGSWLPEQPPQIASELLLTIAKEVRPLIIIDPMRFGHPGKENDSTEMAPIMQCLRYCAVAGGAVINLHHTSKQEGSTGRGSTVIIDHSDMALTQEFSAETGLITLKSSKTRAIAPWTITIRPDFEEGTFDVTDSPQLTKRTNDLDRLKRIITQQPGLSQNGILALAGMMKLRARQLLKDGVNTHWTVQEGPKRSNLYYPIDWVSNLRPSLRPTDPVPKTLLRGVRTTRPTHG